MNKLTAFYTIMFVFLTFLNNVMEGTGGMVATALSLDITSANTTIAADNTTGFLTAGSGIVGDEEFTYTGTTLTTFTGCSRGVNGTTATAHASGDIVYTPEASVINRGLGFNIISVGESGGLLAVVSMTVGFIVRALPNLIMWDFAFFQGEMIYVRYILMAAGIGLAVYYGFMAINTAFGIIRR